VVTSTSVRSARESDRTNELNTNSSRDSGADHGTGYINSIISTPSRQSDFRTLNMTIHTLKFSGTMLSVRMTSNMHDFSSSAIPHPYNQLPPRRALDVGVPTSINGHTTHRFRSLVPH
jgi:hypothetical protein